MGWCGGGELAEDVWAAVRNLLPVGRGRMVAARKIIDLFKRRDCDTIREAESLCADAGYIYDEGRDKYVYTSLPPERGVPEREKFLALARAALTPNLRAKYMALADSAKTDPCLDCHFTSLCDNCVYNGPAKRATFAREPGPSSVNEAARQREIERENERENERTLDAAGRLLAAEVLRRGVMSKSADEIMKEAGVPNMLEGRPLNINLNIDPCRGCTKNGPNGCSACHVCEFGGP